MSEYTAAQPPECDVRPCTQAPTTSAQNSDCLFCQGQLAFAHTLNNHSLYRCKRCDTITTLPKPGAKELYHFYQGFRFQGWLSNYALVKTEFTRNWMQKLSSAPRRMLDFGGGGGFYAKAFEEFGLGTATYLDIDHEACSFARQKLGLQNVINGSYDCLDDDPELHFGFILCRHVIEHTLDPVATIHALIDRLAPGGTLALSCPNALSKEGLLYPTYWQKFISPIRHSNNWSYPRSLLFSLGRNFGWGIDPPRHLWAISPNALRATLGKRSDIHFTIKTAPLADPLYSPYHSSPSASGKRRDRIAAMMFGRFFNGMHLIAEIKRTHAPSFKVS